MIIHVLTEQIKKDLTIGAFGKPGDFFITTRQLAKSFDISIDSAAKLMRRLAEDGYITLCGKHYYITTGYVHSTTPYGKILRDRRKNILGLELHNLDNPFFSTLAEKLDIEARKNGYSLLIQTNHGDVQVENEDIKFFNRMNVSGVFAFPVVDLSLSNSYRFISSPLVILGRHADLPDCDSIVVDNYKAGTQVAQHLCNIGCNSFVYIGITDYLVADFRYRGYTEQLESLGCKVEKVLTYKGVDDIHFYADVRSLSVTLPKPIGIFCYHDLFAVEAARAIKTNSKINYLIPDDIRIVGFDDLPITQYVTPKLTTVSYQFKTMAQKAMTAMLDFFESDNHTSTEIKVDTMLTIRGSTDKNVT